MGVQAGEQLESDNRRLGFSSLVLCKIRPATGRPVAMTSHKGESEQPASEEPTGNSVTLAIPDKASKAQSPSPCHSGSPVAGKRDDALPQDRTCELQSCLPVLSIGSGSGTGLLSPPMA